MHAARIEAQMNLSRAMMEERAQRDIAVQQALAQARAEMADKMGSKDITYITWTPTEDSKQTVEAMMEREEDDADRNDT